MARLEHIAPAEQVQPPGGRYTLDGDAAVEARIDRDQRLIGEAVRAAVDPDHFRALVLMGGYGRGEGGYVEIDGEPAPFNDYDYFVVVRHCSAACRREISARLCDLARELETRVGVEVDFALLREGRLGLAEHSLMNAEMRWGHRVVVGDPGILQAMPPMPFDRLPPGEITRLMLNRGALLLMNRQRRLRAEHLDGERRAVFFKYLFKAILACGDARLAARGQYHPSYPVKLERLEALDLRHHDKFMNLYRLAYRHKFHPDYASLADEHPDDWQTRVVWTWLETLRGFEAQRLGRSILHWDEYCRAHVLKGQPSGLGGPLRSLAVALRDFGVGELVRRPLRCARNPRERLIAALPLLLVESGAAIDACVASALAIPPGASWLDASDAFIARWHRCA